MIFSETTVTLKDGRSCLLRSPTGADAQLMLDYMHTVLDETPYLLRSGSEFCMPAEKEAAFLDAKLTKAREVMITAFDGARIIATCDISPCGSAARVQHRASLGITVLREYWNAGLGSILMQSLIDCARMSGYEQLELTVAASNRRAVSLYLKHGFSVYGTRPRGLRYPDGTYADEYLMVKSL